MSARQAAAPLVLAALLAGCLVHDHTDGHVDGYPDDPYFTTIDADYLLDTELGAGAGLFVEYQRGGQWTLWTSCDTALTGIDCAFDVAVTASSPIALLEQVDLEGYDHVDQLAGDAFDFYAETAFESDAVQLVTEPGAPLQVDVLLDGELAPDYLVWQGDGYLHDGAPWSPVIFEPDQP